MVKKTLFVLGLAVWGLNPARADVVEQQDNFFSIKYEKSLLVSAAQLNQQILDIASWWHPDHTYSGKSDNLYLDVKTERCFCERIENGFVSHLAVVYYQANHLLRLQGGLGPLQNIPVSGVMDIRLKKLDDNHTQLVLTYQVSGNIPALDKWAVPVNQVIGQQFSRLIAKVEKQ